MKQSIPLHDASLENNHFSLEKRKAEDSHTCCKAESDLSPPYPHPPSPPALKPPLGDGVLREPGSARTFRALFARRMRRQRRALVYFYGTKVQWDLGPRVVVMSRPPPPLPPPVTIPSPRVAPLPQPASGKGHGRKLSPL